MQVFMGGSQEVSVSKKEVVVVGGGGINEMDEKYAMDETWR